MARAHINVSIGTSSDDLELKEWVRVKAAQEGTSMADYVKGLLVKARKRDQARRALR